MRVRSKRGEDFKKRKQVFDERGVGLVQVHIVPRPHIFFLPHHVFLNVKLVNP